MLVIVVLFNSFINLIESTVLENRGYIYKKNTVLMTNSEMLKFVPYHLKTKKCVRMQLKN